MQKPTDQTREATVYCSECNTSHKVKEPLNNSGLVKLICKSAKIKGGCNTPITVRFHPDKVMSSGDGCEAVPCETRLIRA